MNKEDEVMEMNEVRTAETRRERSKRDIKNMFKKYRIEKGFVEYCKWRLELLCREYRYKLRLQTRILFPTNFADKYSYLGMTPYEKEGEFFDAIYPLVLAMDYQAKPWWCPRFVLRFLHHFGDDNSIVRVRVRWMHNLKFKITKGIKIYDIKTKWDWYDLRLYVSGPKHIMQLADDLEASFYRRGQALEKKWNEEKEKENERKETR